MEDFMKKIRRILSFIVAMAMIMSMSTLCFLVTAEGGEGEGAESTGKAPYGAAWEMGNEFAIGDVGSTAVLDNGYFGIIQNDNTDENYVDLPLGTTVVEGSDGVASIVASNDKRAFSKSSTGIIDINPANGTSSLVYFKAPVAGTYYYEIDLAGAWAEGATVANWTEIGVREGVVFGNGFSGDLGYVGGRAIGNTEGFGDAGWTHTGEFTLAAGQYIVIKINAQGTGTDDNAVALKKFNVYRTGGDSFAYDVSAPAKVLGNFTLAGKAPTTGEFDPLEDAARNPSWSDSGEWLTWHGSLNSEYTYFAKSQYGGIIDANPKPWTESFIIYTAPQAGFYSFNSSFYKGTDSPTTITVSDELNVARSTIATESSSTPGTTLRLDGTVELKAGEQIYFSIATTDNAGSTEVAVQWINVHYDGHECTAWNDDGTCLTKATCVLCEETTGELNPNNHEADATAYADNGDGTHTVSYDNCCQTPAIESHDFTEGDTCSKGECGAALNAENEDYVISFNPYGDKEVNNEEDIAIELQISGKADQYASGKIVVYYDANVFDFVGATGTLSDVTVDSNVDGKLVIVMYGEDHELTEELQTFATLTFKAKSLTAPESSDIVLGEAGFSTSTLAEEKDLTPAIKYYSTLTVTVNAREFNVALDDELAGDGTAIEGSDYTFTPETVTGPNYNYKDLVVMVDDDNDGVADKDITEFVQGEGNGPWTIPGEYVTGELTITVNRDPKTFNVTVVDDEGNDVSGSWIVGFTTPATYGTDYTFEVIPDTWTNVSGGIKYEVALTIGGVDATADRVGQIYTITGTNVTGDIAIVITDATYEATGVDVVLEGPGLTGNATFAPFGQDYKFTVAIEEGYVYTITYKVGEDGAVMTPALADGQYVVPMAELLDTVYVTVERVEDVVVEVYDYLTLNDGVHLYLIINRVEKLENSHFTMNGDKMFWSERYGAYCYLVASATEVTVEIAEGYTYAVASGAAEEVDYGMDVNKSQKVDANDAQLVYNMYMFDYAGFTDTVTVEKYLRADVNEGVDYKVDSSDATAIATYCLNN